MSGFDQSDYGFLGGEEVSRLKVDLDFSKERGHMSILFDLLDQHDVEFLSSSYPEGTFHALKELGLNLVGNNEGLIDDFFQ